MTSKNVKFETIALGLSDHESKLLSLVTKTLGLKRGSLAAKALKVKGLKLKRLLAANNLCEKLDEEEIAYLTRTDQDIRRAIKKFEETI